MNLILASFVSMIWAATPAEVTIVGRGQPAAVVVLADRPTRPAQLAARELVHFVGKITGAELRVVAESSPEAQAAQNRVLVGESRQTRELGLRNGDFAVQEYLVETRPGVLVLMGHDAADYGQLSYEKNGYWPPAAGGRHPCFTPTGSLYAVHTLLERWCGVRWYLPGELGEVCPRRPELAFSGVKLRTRPWTRFRWSSRQMYREPLKFYGWREPDELVHVPGREMVLWMLRMKIGGSPYACCHSFTEYYERFGREHPDWWKERKPSSRWPHPDYANPELVRQAARDAIAYFATGKKRRGDMAEADYFSIMPNDGRQGLIWSAAGERMRTPDPREKEFSCGWASEFVFSMVNQAARLVGDRHPDKWITCAAYGPYFIPPQRIARLEPNVSIQQCGFLTTAFTPELWAFETGNLKRWAAMTRELYVWEYYLTQAFAKYRAFPVVYPHHIARSMRLLREAGVKGMFFEASAAPAKTGPYSDATLANPAEDLLNHYMTWKYLCDASPEPDALLGEYYRLFFGPAERPMREFFTLLEGRWTAPEVVASRLPQARKFWELMCTPEVLRSARRLIQEARSMATGEPYRTRVELMDVAVRQPLERHFQQHHHELAGRPRIACPAISERPRIDGRLDEGCWRSATQSSPLVSKWGLPVSLRTTFRAARDAENLYIGIAAQGPAGDRAVVMLDPGRTRGRYYQILVGPRGETTGQIIEPGKPTAVWDCLAEARVEGTNVELRLPLAALGVRKIVLGEVWGLDVRRSTCGGADISCWAPDFDALDKPDEFGVLELSPVASPGAVPRPVVRYDFDEDFLRARVVSDGVGRSPARLKLMPKGQPWSERNVGPGVRGRAIVFRGAKAEQYVQIELAPGVNIASDDFTIAFWYKAAGPGGILLGSTTSPPFWLLSLSTGGSESYPLLMFNAGSRPTGVIAFRDGPSPVDGRWHHWTFMVERGGHARLFLDGELAGQGRIADHRGPLKQMLTIGGAYNYLEGSLDELAIYPGTYDPQFAKRLSKRDP